MVPRSNHSQRLLGGCRRGLGSCGEILNDRVSPRHSRRVLFADSMGSPIGTLGRPAGRTKAAYLSNGSGRRDRPYLDMGDLLLRFNSTPPPHSDAQYRTGQLCFPRIAVRANGRLCDDTNRSPNAKFLRGDLPRFSALFHRTRSLSRSIRPVPAEGGQMGWRMVVLFPRRPGGEDDAPVSCPHPARTPITLSQVERGKSGWVLVRRLGHRCHPGCGDVGKPEYRGAPRLTPISSDGHSRFVCCLQPEQRWSRPKQAPNDIGGVAAGRTRCGLARRSSRLFGLFQ